MQGALGAAGEGAGPRDRRLVLSLALCAAIAAVFWAGSRYPDLDEKALMGGVAVLEDPLGFEALLPVALTDPVPVRVLRSTINWLATNARGMTFGLLLAGAFLVLLRLLAGWSFRGRFANSLAGMLVGVPLGVCVNCAAPIARGLHAAGARLETSLAAMISSPTLNVVVLTMLIALFPPYMVALKLGLCLLFLLVGIPLLSRFGFPMEAARSADLGRLGEHSASGVPLFEPAGAAETRWVPALAWVARAYAGGVWFVVRRTVPLMLLAGFLGALAVSLLPWETTAGLLPREGALAIGLATGGLALLGLMLPVPIALDVVVCAGLLATGVPPYYVMVLLFSLGIWSVYSFFVVWEAVSLRVAASLTAALLVLSVAAGAATFLYDRAFDARQQQLIARLAAAPPAPRRLATRPAPEMPDLALLGRDTSAWSPVPGVGEPGLRVSRRRFGPAKPGAGRLFERVDGESVGLVRFDPTPLVYSLTAPYSRSVPIAAGDVHGDGRPDLLIGGPGGLQLFANRDGERFTEQPIEVPALAGSHAANAALVDLDSDGWLDLFVSVYRGGNHVVFNRGGRFRAAGHRELPESAANLAGAVAFGDLDRDGDLEIFLGNWTSGSWTPRPPEASRDVVLWNRDGAFVAEPLAYEPGETLSVALSDVDRDGDLDALVGIDFDVPDVFLFNDGGGRFTAASLADGRFPVTTHSTMSIDVADIDNDLRPEIFEAQITGGAPGQRRRLSTLSLAETCRELPDAPGRLRCQQRAQLLGPMVAARRRGEASLCLALEEPTAQEDCMAMALLRWAALSRDPRRCAAIPAAFEPLVFICEQSFRPPAEPSARGALRQRHNENVLLVPDGDGRYRERAAEMGVDLGGWSWNARFADLDNDEWQDLYVVGGRTPRLERVAHFFFRNRAGTGFEDRSEASGLRSHLATSAYALVDLEGDGDLDIVTPTIEGPVWLHRNGTSGANAIAIELDDALGNATGIGSRVVIHYGPEGGRHQMREVKASGGFSSFDPPALHFGLGGFSEVTRLEVYWSTGEQSALDGPLAAGYRYRIQRERSGERS